MFIDTKMFLIFPLRTDLRRARDLKIYITARGSGIAELQFST